MAHSPQTGHERAAAGAVTGSHGLPPPTQHRSVVLFCAATFFYWTALYLYVPILPVYARSLGASLSLVGVVIASYALPQLLLRIPIGLWFDAVRRRKSLVALGLVMASLGALGLGLAPGIWPLCLARAATGIGAAAWVTFTVYFTSYYPAERAAHAIAVINSVHGAALVVATSSGGAIAGLMGYRHAFFGAALLGTVGLLALSLAREPAARPLRAISGHGFRRVATHPLLLTVSFMAILAQFANFAGLFTFIPVYAAGIGASSADLGLITMLALGASAVAALASVRLAERRSYTFALVLGALMMGAALLAVPFTPTVPLLGAVQVVNGLGRGTLSTITMALSIRSAPPEQRATAMGVYQALYALGMLAGPLVSGFLADSLTLASVFYLCSSLCLVIAAMAFLPAISRR